MTTYEDRVDKLFDGNRSKCPVCGRYFYKYVDNREWGYHIRGNRNLKAVCSYSCMRFSEKSHKLPEQVPTASVERVLCAIDIIAGMKNTTPLELIEVLGSSKASYKRMLRTGQFAEKPLRRLQGMATAWGVDPLNISKRDFDKFFDEVIRPEREINNGSSNV